MLFNAYGAPLIEGTSPEECGHEGAAEFDEEAARGLDAAEVQRRWPRGSWCPRCGKRAIFYASYAHYIAGDW